MESSAGVLATQAIRLDAAASNGIRVDYADLTAMEIRALAILWEERNQYLQEEQSGKQSPVALMDRMKMIPNSN